LRLLAAAGFELVRFQYFEGHIGLRKHGCAALLTPLAGGALKLAAEPAYLVEGHLGALVERGGEQWFVWKSHQVPATPARLAALDEFAAELRALLEPPRAV